MAEVHTMTRAEKEKLISDLLKPHGLTEHGITQLAPLEQVIRLLQEVHLPHNDSPRPSLDFGRTLPGRKTWQPYRNAMVAYLATWVELSPSLDLSIYAAFADYCESKANTTPS